MLIKSLKKVVGFPWGAISSFRNVLYENKILKSYTYSIPIICCGNATVGGSGKTPFTWLLIDILKNELGKKPAILLRGYRSRSKNVCEVDGRKDWKYYGDEARLHYDKYKDECVVISSRNRCLAIEYIQENTASDVVVMDDGLQHRKLNRNLNILILDVSSDKEIEKWRSGFCLPAGDLREKFTSAVKRSGMVVLVNRDRAYSVDPKFTQLFKDIPVIKVNIFPKEIVDQVTKKIYSCVDFQDKGKFIAVSGIAKPQFFLKSLDELKINLEKKYIFADHHEFSSTDIARFKKERLPLITTEKDSVRLQEFFNMENTLFVLRQKPEFSTLKEKEILLDVLQKILS